MIKWLEHGNWNIPGATRGRLEVFVGGETDHPNHVEIDPNWYFRVRGRNGKVRGQSEGYTRRDDAVKACADQYAVRLTGEAHIFTPEHLQRLICPWHLIVQDRDGALARHGLVY